jgi:putative membrane protein
MVLWIKALHVVAVIAWMAGLLYLPRLYVYHCEAEKGSKLSETFKVMERRLLHVIMLPAVVVVWASGAWLAWAQGVVNDRWLWAKFALVVLLTGYHHALGVWRLDFAADWNTRSPRFYRIMNEVPTLLMIGIGVYCLVTACAFLLPLLTDPLVKNAAFWMISFLVASSMGGIQALSRSYFGKLIPPETSRRGPVEDQARSRPHGGLQGGSPVAERTCSFGRRPGRKGFLGRASGGQP